MNFWLLSKEVADFKGDSDRRWTVLSDDTVQARVTYNRPDVYFPMLSNKVKTYIFDCREETAKNLAK